MNEMQVFNYNDNEVRTVDRNGEIWWVLKDVCAILKMKENSAGEVIKRLDEDEYDSIGLTDKLGREQNTYIINESGLYSVILRSDKPEAKPFRKWVTSEVLPSIRKTGGYGNCGGRADIDKISRIVIMTVKELLPVFAVNTAYEEERVSYNEYYERCKSEGAYRIFTLPDEMKSAIDYMLYCRISCKKISEFCMENGYDIPYTAVLNYQKTYLPGMR